MQDPTSITARAVFPQLNIPQFPEQELLKCPRCDSNNTKFCYYNNYNLSQPRHYCKSCKRYWTKGGTLRNIPIGGGTRKTTKRSSSKRSSSSSSSSSSSPLAQTQLSSLGISPGSGQNSEPETKPVPTVGLVLPSPAGGGEGVGSYTSLLGMTSEGQYGNFVLDSLRPNGLKLGQGDGLGQNSGLELMMGNGVSTSQGLIIGGVQNRGDQSSWGGSNNMWPDLAVYTQPGSKFQ